MSIKFSNIQQGKAFVVDAQQSLQKLQLQESYATGFCFSLASSKISTCSEYSVTVCLQCRVRHQVKCTADKHGH